LAELSSLRTWPAVASVAAAAAATFLILLAGLVAVFPSFGAAIRFLLYILAFNLLPGMVIARLLLPGLKELGSFVVYALSIGIVVNLLILIPLWVVGAAQWLAVLPAVATAALFVLRRRLAFGGLTLGSIPGRRALCWAAATLLVTVTPLLTMESLISSDPLYDLFSFHFAFESLIVQDLARGWPPPNLALPDAVLSYNYAAHLWVLAAHENSGVAIEILAARFAPVFLGICAAAQIMVFCRHILRLHWWTTALPVVSVFWIVRAPDIAGRIFGTFTSYSGLLIMSPFFGFLVFFIVVTIICEDLRHQTRPIGWTAVILALLSFVLTGGRVVGAPVLLCAILLLGCSELRRSRKFPWRTTIYLLACGAGFVAGLFLFFTIGRTMTGLGFGSFTGEPFTYLTDPGRGSFFVVPAWLMALHVPRLLAGMAAFLLIAAFQAGFLLPTLIYELRDVARRGATNAQILLLGASMAGIAAVFLTWAPGNSHLTFLHYTNICSSMLGAQGAQRILSRGDWVHSAGGPKVMKVIAISCAGLLLVLQLAQLPASSLNWLGRQTDAIVAQLRTPVDRMSSIRSIASCYRDSDAELLALAAKSAEDPVVILLADIARRCEQYWWLVLYPVQTIEPFSIAFPPGMAVGAFKVVMDKRTSLFRALLAASAQGRLFTPDLLELAGTFPQGKPLFAIVANSLAYAAEPRIHVVARNDRLMLIRIQR
jgi:hypothetical protein